jgi:hypothetical protein
VDVVTAINVLPDKSFAADVIPVPLLKQITVQIALFLIKLFDHSLITGHFPDIYIQVRLHLSTGQEGGHGCFRLSFISPHLQFVSSLQATGYRARQLMNYRRSNDLLPSYQSAYRSFHSTETAVLCVLSDILKAVDSGNVAGLVLIDLSAAFDTVDHDILLRRSVWMTWGQNC